MLAATTGLLLTAAPGAVAHVRVVPDTTAAGGFAVLTFRVPTESETAGTTALRVELPTDTPLTSVRTTPMPGWTAVVERGPLPEPVDRDGATVTEAPLSVTWTAEPGTEVAPGQYEEFALSVGPLPAEGTEVLLPAVQTYSDGETVAWDDRVSAGGSEPEHPAPVLVTTGSADDDAQAQPTGTAAGTAAAGTAATHAAAAGTAARDAAPDAVARWLGGAGLALGVVALLVAVRRGRRPAARPGRGA